MIFLIEAKKHNYFVLGLPMVESVKKKKVGVNFFDRSVCIPRVGSGSGSTPSGSATLLPTTRGKHSVWFSPL